MQAPTQIEPTGLADYLEIMTKAVFQSGMSWQVVEAKWAGFREAFEGFDPERIAAFDGDDVDRLAADTRIIRNRRKIEATVHNAEVLLALDARGRRLRGLAPRARLLRGHRRRPARRVPLPRRHGRLLLPLRGRGAGAAARAVDGGSSGRRAAAARTHLALEQQT